jgi:SNF2 family DNA or RNA helicase
MRRSEITFLGEASDAGTRAESEEGEPEDEDSKPAVSSSHGFQLQANDVKVSVTGASTLRVGRNQIGDVELSEQLRQDKGFLAALGQDFLSNYYKCESMVGTKISKLLHEITEMIQRDSKSKCVVFSQFLGVLDMAAEELHARGIGFVRLDGNCKQHERADALIEFSSNPNVKVFLLSMRAGAVGLTLTAADHCFIMDIAQNSAIEEQAIDRIHRIGQLRPVTVKRFVMQGTVEERLLSVRRSLGVDRTSAGTQICGANILADEEQAAKRATQRARSSGAASTEELDSAKRQRVEILEILFDCKANVNQA